MIHITDYIKENTGNSPLFVCGDSLKVLEQIPNDSIDCVVTSPPY